MGKGSKELMVYYIDFFCVFLSCFPQGEYEQGVLDCNSALEVCKDSRRALYKKALCLKGLGKYKEAYDCSASYLLINPQVKDGQKWESLC